MNLADLWPRIWNKLLSFSCIWHISFNLKPLPVLNPLSTELPLVLYTHEIELFHPLMFVNIPTRILHELFCLIFICINQNRNLTFFGQEGLFITFGNPTTAPEHIHLLAPQRRMIYSDLNYDTFSYEYNIQMQHIFFKAQQTR